MANRAEATAEAYEHGREDERRKLSRRLRSFVGTARSELGDDPGEKARLLLRRLEEFADAVDRGK